MNKKQLLEWLDRKLEEVKELRNAENDFLDGYYAGYTTALLQVKELS